MIQALCETPSLVLCYRYVGPGRQIDQVSANRVGSKEASIEIKEGLCNRLCFLVRVVYL